MLIETVVVFGVPLVTFLLSLWGFYVLGKSKNGHALAGFGGLWLLVSGILTFAMLSASGWDGLGYMFALIGLSAPVGVGGLIGGIVGWVREDHQKYA